MPIPIECWRRTVPIASVMATACLAAACSTGPAGQAPAIETPVVLGGRDNLGAAATASGVARTAPTDAWQAGSDHRLPQRARAQRERALRFGSQSGFRQRTLEIRHALQRRSGELSTVYDFNRVTRPAPGGTGHLIPPVVQQAIDAFNSDEEGATVSAADLYFRVLQPAYLSSVQPTWRDWLVFEPPEAEPVPKTLAPANASERKQAEAWVEEGFRAGTRQADTEFARRLRRLRRDFEGMLEYRRLAALGMVSSPEVALANFGVTGVPGEMRIGDRSVQLVEAAGFIRNPGNWRHPQGQSTASLDPNLPE